MRRILVYGAILCFIALGVIDLVNGRYRTGSAAVLLGIANGLLLL